MRLDPSSGVLSYWLSLASDRHQFPLSAAAITHTPAKIPGVLYHLVLPRVLPTGHSA